MKGRSIVITCHHNGKAASPLIQEEMLLSIFIFILETLVCFIFTVSVFYLYS